ncbi:Chitosanase [Aspergillus sclerotialis]|uniref:Endo-chitosanase n=1 Tax=Aspergillus sclerotialis TaxID=2070753 RepID=A0A3A2Z7K3_9EURO|nr:Chitosanase [Aspergillus sclerotialis]
MYLKPVAFVSLMATAMAYDLPDNMNTIYQNHKSGKCNNKLAGGLSNGVSSSSGAYAYCGDIPNAIFLHTSKHGGSYADMDIDCDGSNIHGGDCGDDPTGQGETAFKSQVQQYGIDDLDATVHPYVVFGNEGGDVEFDPQEYGMQPLGIMAVVCDGKLIYGIWGDTNGGTSTGESSISLAQLCFPDDNISGDNGHSGDDVLYIGFMGDDTVPTNADWQAGDAQTFMDSIKEQGDQLVAKLQA